MPEIKSLKKQYAVKVAMLEAIYREQGKNPYGKLKRSASYVEAIKEGKKEPTKQFKKLINSRLDYYSYKSKKPYAFKAVLKTGVEYKDKKGTVKFEKFGEYNSYAKPKGPMIRTIYKEMLPEYERVVESPSFKEFVKESNGTVKGTINFEATRLRGR